MILESSFILFGIFAFGFVIFNLVVAATVLNMKDSKKQSSTGDNLVKISERKYSGYEDERRMA